MIIYTSENLSIAAFRGSSNFTDIKNDIQLSKPGGGCVRNV